MLLVSSLQVQLVSVKLMIKTNHSLHHSLQILNISVNPIGDEGIAVIARTLDNTRISTLDVRDCSITVTVAKRLAESLGNNHCIKSLAIDSSISYGFENNITVDGTIDILEAAVANGVCQKVIIDECKSDDKVKEFMSILEERKGQEVGSIIA